MAYKSGSNYFLIPCCMFDFYAKFESKQGDKSRSETYLEYLHSIGRQFEFHTYRDKLRIPSTKNACFIGLNNNNNHKQQRREKEVADDQSATIEQRIEAVMGRSSASLEFKARDLTLERAKSTRNCTKNVPDDLKQFIVRTVVRKLVEERGESENEMLVKKHDGGKWNCGGSMSLSQVAGLFEPDVLKKLKLECGGVKTLLRNHGRLFEVFDRDRVRLRRITSLVIADLSDDKRRLLKTKWCPFDQYHPDGCLLDDHSCFFAHLSKQQIVVE